jgi:hypothetical protein
LGDTVPLRAISSLSIIVALAVCAATAQGAAPRLKMPGLAHQGENVTFRLPRTSACALSIRYAAGVVQQAGRRTPRNHALTWVVTVPRNAAIGVATWTASCGATHLSGTFVVVRSRSTLPGGPAAVPRVVVDKDGFTQRPDASGPGSLVSYGLILRNTSATEDAESVYVLVNMVDASGELLGSTSHTVKLVGSAGTFAYGDSLSLRTQIATTRLEITVRVGAHEPKSAHPAPSFANVRILPAQYDPGWVGEVDGEVVNGTPVVTLASAQLSIVVFDATGNVIGGGTGISFTAIPSGSRFVFTATSGFTALPVDKAASVTISVEPTYTNAI